MDFKYLQDKSFINFFWDSMEDMQDRYPHQNIGWWGSIPMFFE